MINRLGLHKVLANIGYRWHAFWLRGLNPMAPAPLVLKHLISATDLKRKVR